MNNQVVTELLIDASGAQTGEAQYESALNKAQEATERLTVTMTGSVSRQAAQWTRLAAGADPVVAAQQKLEKATIAGNAAIAAGRATTDDVSNVVSIYAGRLRTAQVAATGTADAHGALSTQSMAASHAIRGFTEMVIQGVPPSRAFAMEANNITYAMSHPGGLIAAIKEGIAVYASFLKPILLVGAAVGVAYGAFKILQGYTAEATLAVDASTQALAKSALGYDQVRGKITELEGLQKQYQSAIAKTASAQDDATRRIVANTEREFNAKKSLLELELKRQQALIKTQQAELAVQAIELKKQVGQQVLTNPSLVANGYADPLVGRLVQIPDDVTGVQKTLDTITNSAVADKIKELQANMELTKIGAQELEKALQTNFNGGAPAPNQLQKQFDSALASARKETQGIEDQIHTFGMAAGATAEYTKKQELLNLAAKNHIALTPKVLESIDATAKAYGDATEQLDRMKAAAQAQQFLAQSLFDAVRGATSLSDAFQKLASSIGDAVLQATLLGTGPLAGIFGTSASGQSGGLLGSLFGGIVNAFAPVGAPMNLLPHNAAGNDNWPGGLTWVGENGPEIVNVPRGSQIVPNNRAVGSSTTNLSITVPVSIAGAGGGSNQDNAAIAKQVGKMVETKVYDVLDREMRIGGRLNRIAA